MLKWFERLGAALDHGLRAMGRGLRRFFWPGRGAALWRRIMPYAMLLGVLAVGFIIFGAAWEVTNSSEFCGMACHTMPPEYVSYLNSPHARVKCVECHIGRATIATQFFRKAHDISHVIQFVGATYETPIYVKGLRPAQQVCERCHNPEKFSTNSVKEFKTYDAAKNNELTTTYLSFKTGGGTQREGLGKGIHWHIENDIEYIYTDEKQLQQEIPWVRVTDAATGEVRVYTDSGAGLPADFAEQNSDRIEQMDCVTCHNRNSHKFQSPAQTLDESMARGLISPEIPYFKQNALAIMERQYPSMDYANNAIDGLRNYYASNYPDYYQANQELVDKAVEQVKIDYSEIVYPNMDISWTTHPDNAQHKDSPGCFRCHDGKHVSEQGDTIRIECNLCHTIPLKAPQDGSTPVMALSEPFEPESHVDTNWIARHRFEFDSTCEGCHDVSNPGGSDDSSFCANSACHATDWKYAGLNASSIVALTNKLPELLPTYPESPLTWDDLVGPILQSRCVSCHGGTAGLELDTYADAMAGGNLGPAIVPGNAEESPLVKLQKEGHPNSLPAQELDWVIQWINAGAPESQPQS
ncbi:MAG: NapC/NirT family cytochrome c [Anaerolineales bacterium]|nr:NapC/NirT family cytochrome c [Anaerolineales bacterium]